MRTVLDIRINVIVKKKGQKWQVARLCMPSTHCKRMRLDGERMNRIKKPQNK